MQQISEITHPSVSEPALQVMFEARKRVFVDLLKWDVPVLDDLYEVDQFDTLTASYVLLNHDDLSHRASARLLRSDGPHILKDLFPELCTGPVPSHGDFREITRFCIEPTLPRGERRKARNELVSALADHAIAESIAGYTAVAPVTWYRQISQFGWRCGVLGPSQRIDGQELVALRIDIDHRTRKELGATGIYERGFFRHIRCDLEKAA